MGEESIKKSLVFAYYITGHGFGHATRAAEIVRNLIQAGHSVHVVSGAPEYVFTTAIESPRLIIRKVLLDTGAVQADALTVDRFASLETYIATAVVPRASILAVEVQWLKSIKADFVVSDVVPVACRAAAAAGIPSVCVTNFSWDFIYAEYVMAAGHDNRSIIWQIAEDYSQCEFLIRLPGYCPMPAFRDVVDVPLVVRRLHKSREEVRKELGVKDGVKVLVYNFGGQLSGWNLKEEFLPSGWICWVCGASNSQKLPKNFVKLPKNIYTPDVVAAADCMLGKIGYGTASEALAYGVPFIFVRRDYFNEEPFLRHMLEQFQCGVEMIRRDLLTGHWEPYLKRAITLKPCYEGGKNGAEVAASILQDAATGKHDTSSMHSGSRRLQDAIILGYQLQGVPGVDIAVPEWYTAAQNELSSCTASPNDKPVEASSLKMQNADYEILHGDHHGLSDTMGFIKSLIELRDLSNPGNTNGHHARETLAAAAMFSWKEEIFVTRAPGRLDVMGGIADYSGSLVLQMPMKEACHVAIQRNHPSKQKLWKRAEARQQTEAPKPVIQIVSFGSELSNRGPTFDMDLSDLMDGDKPISYEKARKYFSQDPSQKWAAYAAGTFLVLMIELGVRFEDSVSMLVSSRVPEGKGVSSSAAVEVACMSALAAAYGLDIAPRDLALLCQKVENHVVGAPCGVMDQMASACGEANKLLAMICQPAEVLGLVEIPPHIRFWGIDSGIRHSVGGADYGSVRIGAFMGRKIIKYAASKSLSVNSSQKVKGNISGLKDHDAKSLLDSEVSLDYLCNMSPHRFESSYSIEIPEALHGQDFLDKYVNHEDSVTVIDKKHTYSVRAPATHPIYENFRVKAFKAMLSAVPSDDQLSSLGELMYQCHNSYNNCGLGSDGTDRLVELVQEVQHSHLSKSDSGTLFGAKITGGGSGGTVCAIGRNCLKSSEEIIKIQSTYKAATGYLPYIFEGSSPGAGKFGYLKLRLKSDSK